MKTPLTLRQAALQDAAAICEIYNYYIENTTVSFDEIPVTEAQMAQRIVEVTAGHPWLVCMDGDRLVGYACARPWKAKSAYRFCVETSVYVRQDAAGRGIGSALYAELIRCLKSRGIRILIGCIALPNTPSVALHEKFGFRQVSHFPAVGFKFDQWIDVGDWQLTFS